MLAHSCPKVRRRLTCNRRGASWFSAKSRQRNRVAQEARTLASPTIASSSLLDLSVEFNPGQALATTAGAHCTSFRARRPVLTRSWSSVRMGPSQAVLDMGGPEFFREFEMAVFNNFTWHQPSYRGRFCSRLLPRCLLLAAARRHGSTVQMARLALLKSPSLSAFSVGTRARPPPLRLP